MEKLETREEEQLSQGRPANEWQRESRNFQFRALSAAAGGRGGHLDQCGQTGVFVLSAAGKPCLEEPSLLRGLERTRVPRP